MLNELVYSDCKKAVLLTLKGIHNRVPMIMGERGCGKTSIAYDIAEELNANIISIDANVLKEGEIGGLPIVFSDMYTSYKATPSNKDETVPLLKYAVHVKLHKVDKLADDPEKRTTILFIDELNRCDSIVKRELMNLILNREINDFKLKDNVKIIAACNPSSIFGNYENSEYQVEEMDEAQMDRFRFILLKSDLDEWIKWGLTIDPLTKETKIDPLVMEYLADREDLLNNISTSKEDIKTSPRSWQFASDTFRDWLANKNEYSAMVFKNTIAGDVGYNIAADFYSYYEEAKNPLITVKELFEAHNDDKLTSEQLTSIRKESIMRKRILISNCLRYILNQYKEESNDTNISKKFLIKEKLFVEVITTGIDNEDLMYGILLDLKITKDALNKEYLNRICSDRFPKILNAFTKLSQV